MKTIKLPYKTTEDLQPLIKQYNNVLRYSYNRFYEGKTEKQIRLLSKSLNSVDLLSAWFIQCAIKDAEAIHKRNKDKKVIFGGKQNFYNRLKNKITKEEFQLKRLTPLSLQGEQLNKGNRSFNLNIIQNNKIIFKVNRNNHIELTLPNLRNNIKNQLFKLQQLNEVKCRDKGYTYSVRLSLTDIYISYEQFKEDKDTINLNENRYLGIDLNPDTIGISVLDNDKITHTQEFSLKPLFNKILSQTISSDSNRMKYFQNKLKHETLEISKSISLLAKYYNCKSVYVEDLNFKGKSSYIRILNRKNKNLWKRELFIKNLTKRLNIFNIKTYSVNPAYTSYIGNLTYDYTDAVNASIQIARRGYVYRIKKDKTKFYPSLQVKHLWKEMATNHTSWKSLCLEIKNLKLRYRVSLDECLYKFKVFQQNSNKKSMVLNYVFYE